MGISIIPLSQKWLFSSSSVLINCLGSQLRTDRNVCNEIWTKPCDPSGLYQISSLTKPQWVENTALTLHRKPVERPRIQRKSLCQWQYCTYGHVLLLTIVCQIFSCMQKCQWHEHIENPVDSRRTRVSWTSSPKWINFRIDSPGHRTHPYESEKKRSIWL